MDDLKRSVTGATIVPGWTLPTGTVAIMGGAVIDRNIAIGVTTATRGTKVIRAIAVPDVTIATREIIATISAEEREIRVILLTIRLPSETARREHWECRRHSDGSSRLDGGAGPQSPNLAVRLKRANSRCTSSEKT